MGQIYLPEALSPGESSAADKEKNSKSSDQINPYPCLYSLYPYYLYLETLIKQVYPDCRLSPRVIIVPSLDAGREPSDPNSWQ